MQWLPKAKDARALSLITIAIGVLICAASVVYGFRGEKTFGRAHGGDFVIFYIAGDIVREQGAAHLYDFPLHYDLYHRFVPEADPAQMLHYGHAPFLAVLFAPLSLIPYRWAYCAWLAISGLLYWAGLRLLRSWLPAGQRTTAALVSISFMPFLFETWIGGQASVITFAATALAMYLRKTKRAGWAGLALALCCFRPTFLAVPGLMLLLGRNWRMLAGMIAGVAALILGPAAIFGGSILVDWYHALDFFRWLATGEASVLRINKYVDLNAFFRILLGPGLPATIAAGVVAAVGVVLLGLAWRRSTREAERQQDWLWAATLTAALVINAYVPIYDTVLLVVAAHLAAFAVQERAGTGFAGWMTVLYLTAWFTQTLAELARLQVFTLLMIGFAYWCVRQSLASRYTE